MQPQHKSILVKQRRHELGIRMAIGAQARDVTRLVVAALETKRFSRLLSLPHYEALRDQSDVFEDIVAYDHGI